MNPAWWHMKTPQSSGICSFSSLFNGVYAYYSAKKEVYDNEKSSSKQMSKSGFKYNNTLFHRNMQILRFTLLGIAIDQLDEETQKTTDIWAGSHQMVMILLRAIPNLSKYPSHKANMNMNNDHDSDMKSEIMLRFLARAQDHLRIIFNRTHEKLIVAPRLPLSSGRDLEWHAVTADKLNKTIKGVRDELDKAESLEDEASGDKSEVETSGEKSERLLKEAYVVGVKKLIFDAQGLTLQSEEPDVTSGDKESKSLLPDHRDSDILRKLLKIRSYNTRELSKSNPIGSLKTPEKWAEEAVDNFFQKNFIGKTFAIRNSTKLDEIKKIYMDALKEYESGRNAHVHTFTELRQTKPLIFNTTMSLFCHCPLLSQALLVNVIYGIEFKSIETSKMEKKIADSKTPAEITEAYFLSKLIHRAVYYRVTLLKMSRAVGDSRFWVGFLLPFLHDRGHYNIKSSTEDKDVSLSLETIERLLQRGTPLDMSFLTLKEWAEIELNGMLTWLADDMIMLKTITISDKGNSEIFLELLASLADSLEKMTRILELSLWRDPVLENQLRTRLLLKKAYLMIVTKMSEVAIKTASLNDLQHLDNFFPAPLSIDSDNHHANAIYLRTQEAALSPSIAREITKVEEEIKSSKYVNNTHSCGPTRTEALHCAVKNGVLPLLEKLISNKDRNPKSESRKLNKSIIPGELLAFRLLFGRFDPSNFFASNGLSKQTADASSDGQSYATKTWNHFLNNAINRQWSDNKIFFWYRQSVGDSSVVDKNRGGANGQDLSFTWEDSHLEDQIWWQSREKKMVNIDTTGRPLRSLSGLRIKTPP